jgi:hypothetical protein
VMEKMAVGSLAELVQNVMTADARV